MYDIDLEGQPVQRVWAYRKAAWAVEDLEQDIGLVYRMLGLKGLQSVPDIGPRLARRVEELIRELEESQNKG